MTAVPPKATMGTRFSMASTRGTPKPSCSDMEMKTCGALVVREQFIVRDAVGEDDVGRLDPEFGIEADERVEVVRLDGNADPGFAARMLAHREQADAGRDVLLEVGKDAQQVVVPLVRSDTADEEEVDARVGKTLSEHGVCGLEVPVEVDGDGKDTGADKALLGELGAVELAVAEGQSGDRDQRAKTLKALAQDLVDLAVPGAEESGRGDVVVLEHAPAAELRECLVHRGDERVVEDHDVRGTPLSPLVEGNRGDSLILVVGVGCPRRSPRTAEPRA